jgi:transposase
MLSANRSPYLFDTPLAKHILHLNMSNRNRPKHRPGAELFLKPHCAPQRQYEALRAYLVEGVPAAEAAARFGYSTATLYSLCRDLRAGRLQFFTPTKPGPKRAPKRDTATRTRVVSLRKLNYSIYDIQNALQADGITVSHVLIAKILRAEGFARLPRRASLERGEATHAGSHETPDVRTVDWERFREFDTRAAGLLVFVPGLVALGVHRWLRKGRFPGSQAIPALQWVLSLLALRLIGADEFSNVGEASFDPGFALFGGLNVMPTPMAISSYSHEITPEMIRSVLESYTHAVTRAGLLPGREFNLDFHRVPRRGPSSVLERRGGRRRGRRERIGPVFLVQDNDSQVLCYANARVRSARAAEEILSFVEFRRRSCGTAPPRLVFDSQLTTYVVLDRLDREGIVFVALRRRGQGLLAQLRGLSDARWKRITLTSVSRRDRVALYTESKISLRHVRRPLRQVAVRGLGFERPALFITNDLRLSGDEFVQRHAPRVLVESSVVDDIAFFHRQTLGSALPVGADFDIVLTLVASALYRDVAKHLPGYETARPEEIYRRFLSRTAQVSVTPKEVVVRMPRSGPPLRPLAEALTPAPAVPWWGGRSLRVEAS